MVKIDFKALQTDLGLSKAGYKFAVRHLRIGNLLTTAEIKKITGSGRKNEKIKLLKKQKRKKRPKRVDNLLRILKMCGKIKPESLKLRKNLSKGSKVWLQTNSSGHTLNL